MQEANITLLNEVSKPAFSITPIILWLIFAVIFSFFVIISVVIIYHWRTYGYSSKATSRAIKVYLFGSVCIVVSTIISILLYTISL